ncbi:MAG: phosphoribosylaminoimidazolesuccinocarboxamide synthase [Cellvibrionales bacterium]|nr:phosphoribosylaminoimidazolesuccinocarboxamide synthase [Cellvibrionales bacterium]
MSTVNLNVEKQEELYKGKAKTVYATNDAERLILFFRNDTSAFDGKKLAQLDRKGMVNNKFNAFIMQKLQAAGVPTHFEGLLNDQECVVKKLKMLPVECVVRNMAAGSMCRRLGIAEGKELNPPTFEFFLKDDSLGDPMINESHIETFGWATKQQVEQMKVMTLKVNQILKDIFLAGNMLLVDSKLEFGLFNGDLVLGDEFSPDGCRLWDKETREKLDKDRFRQDLGDVVEAYEQVARRIGVPL